VSKPVKKKRAVRVAASATANIAITNPVNQSAVPSNFTANGTYGGSGKGLYIVCYINHSNGQQYSSGQFAPGAGNAWSYNFTNIPTTNGQFVNLTAELHAGDGTLLAADTVQISVN
jgi:hypothetical protein